MNEPLTPPGEHVPDSVLDELKLAFGIGDTHTIAAPDPRSDPFSDPDVTVLPDAVVDDEAIALALAAAGEEESLADTDDDRPASPSSGEVMASAMARTDVVEPPGEIAGVRIVRAPVAAPAVVPVDPILAAHAAAGDTPTPRASAPTTADEPPRTTTIVIGGDDDLPDAVYLDDAEPIGLRSGGDPSSRTTIVIGDELDSTGAFDAVSVPARSMDPRVRARRIAVKRAAGRKRLVWTAAIVGVVVVVVGVLAVFSSSLFAVEQIDVQGATYTSARNDAQLQAVVEELRGEPVLLVDTRRAELQLEQIPWIERAFVTTDFPNRVLIDVRERLPLATYVGSDGRYRVIDRDGRVLDVLDGRPADYMLLTGTGPDLEPGALSGTPFAQAAQLVGALPAELRARTVSASVDATTGDLGLVLQGDVDPAAPDVVPRDIEVRLGNSSGLDSKLARLLQQTRDGLDGVARLDVSTDEVIRSPV